MSPEVPSLRITYLVLVGGGGSRKTGLILEKTWPILREPQLGEDTPSI